MWGADSSPPCRLICASTASVRMRSKFTSQRITAETLSTVCSQGNPRSAQRRSGIAPARFVNSLASPSVLVARLSGTPQPSRFWVTQKRRPCKIGHAVRATNCQRYRGRTSYCSDLNPDESLNCDLITELAKRSERRKKGKWASTVKATLDELASKLNQYNMPPNLCAG